MSSRRTGLIAWCLCSLVFLVTATLEAQPQEKQPPEKQPPAKQPPQKPNRSEEEEETKPATPPAKTAPSKAERKEPEKPVEPPRSLKPPPQVLPLGTGPFDLVEEAKKATNPEVKKLLEELSATSDELVSDSGKVYKISALSKRFDRNDTRPLTVKPVTGDTVTFQANQIRSVSHYEQRALDRVRAFLDRTSTPARTRSAGSTSSAPLRWF